MPSSNIPIISNLLATIRLLVNDKLRRKDRFDTVVLSTLTWFLLYFAYKLWKHLQRYGLHQGFEVPLKRYALKQVRRIPQVRAKIDAELDKATEGLDEMVLKDVEHRNSALPQQGKPSSELLPYMEKCAEKEHKNWENGGQSGCVYHGGEELYEMQGKVLGMFALSNLLHADVFTKTRQMEAEVIAMTLDLFNGKSEEGACGSVTSGGTESILLAMKAYRDWGRAECGITEPNIVIPHSAHAAFIKAGQYFGIDVRVARLTEDVMDVNLNHVESLINKNTVAIVGSCPQFPQGVVDNIEGLAKIALEHKTNLHVDCCLGGYLLPFMEENGFPMPTKFDFRVPGVTSISCDTHKYGFSPKGTSVLMFRSPDLRKYQYSTCSEWPGGIYGTPTICGSRPAAAVAATWATLMHIGHDGYKQSCKTIVSAAKQLEKGIDSIDGIRVLGRPSVSVVAITCTNGVNDYDLAEWLKENTKTHWNLNMLQMPSGVHICVTRLNAGKIDELLKDIEAGVEAEKAKLDSGVKSGHSGIAAVYGSAASVPKELADVVVAKYLDTCYKA
ncbi:Sphingosine-1-phosphate lyase 1 [Perkinsus olseni]|uniref:sphinganine-1-phosphate aldolase n=1 Tax=Perkinsus olseni TaxID=32597 RepID=A0A7J6NNF9_PEROL|nr:Sphingosine-1-phosphate lyase 1 [Perkinsus olseni]